MLPGNLEEEDLTWGTSEAVAQGKGHLEMSLSGWVGEYQVKKCAEEHCPGKQKSSNNGKKQERTVCRRKGGDVTGGKYALGT